MKTKTLFSMLTTAAALALLSACEKPPGPGGRATIKGRIYAYDWDNQQYRMISEGFSSDDRVYISYGNSTMVGNDTRTGTDGSFQFRFLNKGHYRIFVNSIDTALKYKGNDTYIPIVKEVDVTKANQEIDLGTIKINK